MNLAHLSAFLAVANARGFTRGAEDHGVTQPAVSRQVAELERSLGVTLIDRAAARFALTEAGELLAGRAREIFALVSRARTELTDLAALRVGRLRIGATPTLGTYLLPRVLVYFRTRFPSIVVTVDIGNHRGLLRQLRGDALDVVLSGRATTAEGRGRLASVSFAEDRVAAVVATGHTLARAERSRKRPKASKKGEEIDGEELKRHTLLLRDASGRSPAALERALRARRLFGPDVMRLPHTESVKQAALAGLGVAFLPWRVVEAEVTSGRLRELTVRNFSLTRSSYWIERGGPRSKAAQAFWCVLKHAVRGSLPIRRQ